MSHKGKDIRKEKKRGLTDKELIEKYGSDKPQIEFEEMITVLLNKPNPNAPTKAKRQ